MLEKFKSFSLIRSKKFKTSNLVKMLLKAISENRPASSSKINMNIIIASENWMCVKTLFILQFPISPKQYRKIKERKRFVRVGPLTQRQLNPEIFYMIKIRAKKVVEENIIQFSIFLLFPHKKKKKISALNEKSSFFLYISMNHQIMHKGKKTKKWKNELTSE